jgi:hypothetical protein
LRARISNEAQTNKSWLDKFHFARTSPNDLRRRDETTPPVSLCLGSPTTLPHFPVQSTVHPTTQTLESRRRPTPPPPPPRPPPRRRRDGEEERRGEERVAGEGKGREAVSAPEWWVVVVEGRERERVGGGGPARGGGWGGKGGGHGVRAHHHFPFFIMPSYSLLLPLRPGGRAGGGG